MESCSKRGESVCASSVAERNARNTKDCPVAARVRLCGRGFMRSEVDLPIHPHRHRRLIPVRLAVCGVRVRRNSVCVDGEVVTLIDIHLFRWGHRAVPGAVPPSLPLPAMIQPMHLQLMLQRDRHLLLQLINEIRTQGEDVLFLFGRRRLHQRHFA